MLGFLHLFVVECGIFISLNTLQYFLETAKEPENEHMCLITIRGLAYTLFWRFLDNLSSLTP